MDKIKKFLLTLGKKDRTLIRNILEDILSLSLKSYDIKPLKGHRGFFRLRKGNIRIVFTKEKTTGIIIDIDYRKNIYKKWL